MDQDHELHVERKAALNGQIYAGRRLKQAKEIETSPNAFAIERMKGQDPGPVARMMPMLKHARLLDDAHRHLKQQRADEMPAWQARLAKEILEKRRKGPEHGRGRYFRSARRTTVPKNLSG